VVRRAFADKGHDVWSCDLLPADDGSPNHIEDDVLKILGWKWDMMIAHPPCTHLAVSGATWFKDKVVEQEEALSFVKALLEAPIEHIALENPVSVISTRIRKPDQIIQPYQFGHNASKRTCLWLKNLPLLTQTKYVAPKLMEQDGKVYKRWANQTLGGQNKLGPSPDRWKIRSTTYAGIANAMADQWG
jgi:hypothetical protein